MWREAAESGGVIGTELCNSPDRGDWEHIMTVEGVRIPLRFADGTRDVVMRWEQGRWKVARMEFRRLVAGRR
jgi:hypothetical protein